MRSRWLAPASATAGWTWRPTPAPPPNAPKRWPRCFPPASASSARRYKDVSSLRRPCMRYGPIWLIKPMRGCRKWTSASWEGRAWQAIGQAELEAWTDGLCRTTPWAMTAKAWRRSWPRRLGLRCAAGPGRHAVDHPRRRDPGGGTAGAGHPPDRARRPVAAGRAEIWTMAATQPAHRLGSLPGKQPTRHSHGSKSRWSARGGDFIARPV